jgi:hypothetical protein
MRLEYLDTGAPACPLIRLYSFTEAEAGEFVNLIEQLASQAAHEVCLHQLPWVQALGSCRLTLRVRSWDQALVLKAAPANFECGFTPGTWDNVAGLVEPFAHGAGGFQWLTGVPGEAALLLSPSGQW